MDGGGDDRPPAAGAMAGLRVLVAEDCWQLADELARAVAVAEVPADVWRRLSCGEGAKGPRLYDWAAVGVNCPEPESYGRWLLIRRSVAAPAEVAYFLCGGPPVTTLTELVRVAGHRWAIEECFALAKGGCGLDEYEVRSWVGWHRHITSSMLALAHLAAVRKAAVGGCGPGGPDSRLAADHGAGSQATTGRPRRPTATQARGGSALVALAPKAPAARTTRALAPADTGAFG